MNSWERYVYRVEWSDEDGEFVGLCAELPGLSWLAKSRDEALKGIVAVAREAVDILKKDGEAVPAPSSISSSPPQDHGSKSADRAG